MKALTIRQPWASAIIRGWKPIENRDWYTHHRGPFAVHAAQQIDKSASNRVINERREQEGPDEQLPRGVLLGVVDLYGIYSGVRFDPWEMPTRYHWQLRNPKPLAEPIPWSGRLGLWDLPDDVLGGAP